MPKKIETTTVRIHKKRIGTLNVLCKKSDKSQVDYISQMVLFISKTGLNVFENTDPNIPDLIKNLDRRIVSFLKQREKDFFLPMQKNFIELIGIFKNVLIGLENFDLVNLTKNAQKTIENKTSEAFIIPSNLEEEENIVKKSTENYNDVSINKNEIFIELEDKKRENEIYKNEILFLLKNIRSGSPLSGVKFVINITQNDIKRIKKLIE